MQADTQKSANEENMGELLKNSVSEFCDGTTIHGIPRIANSSNHVALGIFWALCTLGMTIYSIFSCKKVFDSYYSWPTSTKISTVIENPTLFPKVTICNIKFLDCSKNETLGFIKQNSIKDEFSARVAMGNSNLSDKEKKQLGYSISGMLNKCFFNSKKCSPDQFPFFYSAAYGNCYSINSGYYANGSNQTIFSSRSKGVKNGLRLAINLGDPSADLYDTYVCYFV